MNGIDVASYQTGIDLTKVPCDFVIVKATQGTKYVNPDFKRACEQALKAGKLLGVYHYASSGGAKSEANHFLKTVQPYIGKAILVLDWEEEDNKNFPSEKYAKNFLDHVRQQTGVIPFLYAGKYNVQRYGWATIAAAGYPLWAAQYKTNQPTTYQENPWTDDKGFGAWSGCAILQYSSKGRLDNWGGNLDLNKAYINADTWKVFSKARTVEQKPFENYAAVVTATKLNVRAGAGAEFPIQFLIPQGMVIAIEAEENGFGKIASIDGWVSLKWVKKAA